MKTAAKRKPIGPERKTGAAIAAVSETEATSPPLSLQLAPEAIFDLRRVPFPTEFAEGARNVVATCLRIQPDEKVTLITDDASLQVAASIAAGLEASGCEWNAFVLEAIAPRPLVAMPAAVLEDMETSHASIFAVAVEPGELQSRMQMTEVVNRRRMRHAHMVNITGEIMTQGLRVDFNDIDRLSQALLERVRSASYIRATTPAGTDIHAQLTPAHRWFKTSGILTPGRWSNLPAGQCFTAPAEVNGVFVVDGVAGDFLCGRYGSLRETPLTIDIEGNRIARVRCANKELERDFWSLTHTDGNSDRVGEIAIGTNIGVDRIVGNMVQDDKLPGVQIAFGDPYGAQTGAPWKSATHVDVVGLNFSIWLGDASGEEQIMRNGEFTLDH
ncbi:MAG: aminopeptidase [Acidobacteriota bacterium]|nr:aminopeptidase [Acidobacteriota bacterium]